MADKKTTQLTALTPPPTGDDLIYAVNDPAGTPASYKISLANLLNEPIFVENLGTNWNKYALGAGVFRVVRTFTNDQIKALPNTGGPLTVVPAPGALKVAIPVFGSLFLNWTADYSTFDAAATIGFQWHTLTGLPFSLLSAGSVSLLLASAADTLALFALDKWAVSTTIGTNKAIDLAAVNDGDDFTDGNAANTLIATVDYKLITIA